MACLSDHEGFDLKLAISKVIEGGFRRIALQFPDEHLFTSISVYQNIIKGINNDDIDVFIIGDSTFGSSVDDVSAQHVDADVLLYFGSDLSSSGTMPVMIVPYQKKVVNLDTMVTCFLDTIDPMVHVKHILLLYEPGYHHCMNSLSLSLRTHLDQIKTINETPQVIAATLPPCADLEHWRYDTVSSSVPGNNVTTPGAATTFKVGGLLLPLSVQRYSPSDTLVWYIGEKNEQIVSIHLQLSHLRMITYSPFRSQFVSYMGSDSIEFRERCGGFLRVKDAKIVGLIVGSMGMTGETTKDILHRLETLISTAKKSSYVFVMGRLNEAKLCNFPEIDIFCLISNDDVALIKPKTFHKPVITPWELEVGLGAREWDGTFCTESSSILTSGLSLETAISRVVENLPENPIDDDDDDCDIEEMNSKTDGLSMGIYSDNSCHNSTNNVHSASDGDAMIRKDNQVTESSSSCNTNDDSNMALTTVNNERQMTAFSSAAAVHFVSREYQGLLPQVPEGHDTTIQPGQFGIAAGYVPIPPVVTQVSPHSES